VEEIESVTDVHRRHRLVRTSISYPRMASTEKSSPLTSVDTLGTMLSYDRATTR
jgi:hypothetical protein